MKTALRLTVAAFILATLNVSAATLYVSLNSPNPTPPYISWATAATNIQDAVDVARSGDTVLVTNGVYASGSREASVLDTNWEPPWLGSVGLSRVVVTNAIKLESVNGPEVTVVKGSRFTNEWGYVTNGIRCVFLGTNAILSGFTLKEGWAGNQGGGGGGLLCDTRGVATNCILSENRAGDGIEGHGGGGGALGGVLYNCILTRNSSV